MLWDDCINIGSFDHLDSYSSPKPCSSVYLRMVILLVALRIGDVPRHLDLTCGGASAHPQLPNVQLKETNLKGCL